MICAKCGGENPVGKKFCGDCGEPLSNRCAKCSADNPTGKRFCGECGTLLGSGALPPSGRKGEAGEVHATEIPPPESLSGERKTVTALFADLKGSTGLMESLDPEEARAIIDPALKIMVGAVRRYDGYVVQSTGDGIFALFGAPAAYEDHPQRSLHAALQIQQGLRECARRLANQEQHRLKPVPLEARIGINTGEVVVRTVEIGGKVEYTPIGHTINLAARLQAIAPAGSIAVSDHTRKLVEGYFELRALGPIPVRGISEPINVYEVTGLGPLKTHFQLSARRGLTKFIGRERELMAMQQALELAMSGDGQIIAVVAEAGTGKSRLLYEFKATLPGECEVLEAYSVSHGKASPYQPVLELLYDYFGIGGADDRVTRRGKIEYRVDALDHGLKDIVPYVFVLLGIQDPPDSLGLMDPQVKRKRTMEGFKRIVLRESLKQPLLSFAEVIDGSHSSQSASLSSVSEAAISIIYARLNSRHFRGLALDRW